MLPSQKRASRFDPERDTQKFSPSLHAPYGFVDDPVETVPIGVKSDAFHSETLLPLRFAVSIRSPSNATLIGPFRPLPVRVARTVPASDPVALTTTNAFEFKLGTQMFVPSKAGYCGLAFAPIGIDRRIAPFESSFFRVCSPASVTHMFAPS